MKISKNFYNAILVITFIALFYKLIDQDKEIVSQQTHIAKLYSALEEEQSLSEQYREIQESSQRLFMKALRECNEIQEYTKK